MMPHGIPLMPHMMGPRPLFPAAAASVPSTGIGHHQQKPTFPAYSNATISAPPTTNLGNQASNSNANPNDTQKPPTIPQNTGTASKIMHPPEDLSLEEMKSRRPQYKINKAATTATTSAASSYHHSHSVPTSSQQSYVNKMNEAKFVQAAHEVRIVRKHFLIYSLLFSIFINDQSIKLKMFMKICLSLINVSITFRSKNYRNLDNLKYLSIKISIF